MAVDTDWARDGRTHDSGSVISGLTSLDDDTDEFGRMLLQHVRDEQRLNRVLNGPAQAFRKARPQPRIAATLENGTSNRDYEVRSLSSGGSDPGVAEHTRTNGSDPPLNIPRDWGRKGRQSTSWLRRLGDTELEMERRASADNVRADGVVDVERGARTVDWASDVARVVQSVEQTTPLSSRSRRRVSSPGQPEQSNSIERIRQWEAEQDFTAGSFLQSTPAAVSRRRELESIETRGIARDQLSRISERTSPESVRERLEFRLSRIAGQPLSRRRKPSPEDKQWGGRRALLNNTERVPIKKEVETAELPSTSNGVSYTNNNDERPLSHRPSAGRQESIQLLKRLARVSSQSPSPSPNTGPLLPPKQPTGPESRSVRQSSAQAPEVVPVSPIHATPRPPPSNHPAKTPKVTGAWIDTPLPIRHDSAQPPEPPNKPASPTPEQHPQQDEPAAPPLRPLSAPPSAPSALSHLLSTAPPNVGDDTLASLQDLLDPTLAQPDVSATLNLDDVQTELDRLHGLGRPLSKADEERRDELLVIEGMAGRLRSARRGVRDVKRGLRGMERRVGSGDWGGEMVGGGEARGVWKGLLGEGVRVLVYEKRGRRGLTRFGTALALVAAWWALENAACAAWCQPRYATRMAGFGVDPSAPRYPFVVPTMLFRPLRWLWRPVTSTLVWLLGQLWTGLVAYLGILFEEEPVGPTATATVVPKPQIRRSKRSGMWTESDPIFQIREKTKVKEWDDRVADIIHEAVPVQETMEEDKVVRQARRETRDGFGFAKLWSWNSAPVDSVVETAPSSESSWQSGEEWHGAVQASSVDAEPMWETGDVMGGDELI
ncbi:hypothetical protein CAC42_4283 [Sphaceloma murrayae]|uniref:Uncharacterized protein n=1 Tax=Sphaceloma murrayae TaxID=2082308 RepID=A0A2K1QLJ7_9PEZI|nr:hypothetical protein CAC42_4283 [Sphaceloma murrayae]